MTVIVWADVVHFSLDVQTTANGAVGGTTELKQEHEVEWGPVAVECWLELVTVPQRI